MQLENLRIGSGFDVHQFAEGRKLMMGGIEIPFEKGLLGHSDADVVLHAVVDAVLSALGEGDIGQHFPPSDPKWRGAPSIEFIKFVRERVAKRGATLLSVDVTVICERPKVSPHVLKMREVGAAALGIAMDRYQIKATTTEKLGFTGREEGIAAQAVCLLAI